MPLANEAETVVEFLVQVCSHLDTEDIVFCVLDNASKDRTRELASEFGRSNPRVRVVWAPQNRSVVDAYFRGYREAMEEGCDWILEMDGGMSHDPAAIPLFIDAMSSGVDFAAGSRFVPGGRHHGRPTRYLLSKGGTLLARILLGAEMLDMTSGYECFSRPAMAAVLSAGVESRGHFFQTEIRHLLAGWNWVEVPIQYRCPSKSVGGQTILEAFQQLARLSRRRFGGPE